MSTGVVSPTDGDLDEDSLQELFTWIDEIPLSRPKKSITRDFSDGVLVAEIVKNFLPKLVDIHNYSPANSLTQKLTNWSTLNRKVLTKHLNYTVSDNTINNIVNCKAGAIEHVLFVLRGKIEKHIARREAQELRKQQKVYDDFSPEGPVKDHTGFNTEEYYPNGADNNYGYAFNTVPGWGPGVVPTGYPIQPQPEMSGFHPGAPPAKPPISGTKQGDAGPPTEGSSMRLRPRGQSYNNVDGKGRINPTGKGGKVARAQSYQDVSVDDQPNLRLILEEKEQALLASQETIQILQAKMRRLEHLLHLKDLRIDDLAKRLQSATHPLPRQLPPQQNAPQPGTMDTGVHPAVMQHPLHHPNPLPPLNHHQPMQQQ
ncbi:sperm flagellar protein 1 [Nematostella vectensis]|uniref:sperm flagellar protein 1 n=1 Tax=Nematostella vectensis TaxID=45351 RepID=UPI002077959E|nr:sperm flagellar protein 1 [Nematostella vectensis]